MSSWQTGGQRERDDRRKNKKCNKRYINTNTEANANSKRKLWLVSRLSRRDGQKPKKRLVGERAVIKVGRVTCTGCGGCKGLVGLGWNKGWKGSHLPHSPCLGWRDQ